MLGYLEGLGICVRGGATVRVPECLPDPESWAGSPACFRTGPHHNTALGSDKSFCLVLGAFLMAEGPPPPEKGFSPAARTPPRPCDPPLPDRPSLIRTVYNGSTGGGVNPQISFRRPKAAAPVSLRNAPLVVFKNGRSGLHAEHSWGDAPVARPPARRRKPAQNPSKISRMA